MTPEKPEPAKRFYTSVAVAERPGGYGITLDGRNLRTPKRGEIALARPLAEELAREWDAQTDFIVPLAMPLTRLVNTALDGVCEVTGEVRSAIAAFAEHDLVLYRADHPQNLVARQAALWDPVVALSVERFALPLRPTQGIMPVAQDPAWREKIIGALPSDPLALAALHQLTSLTGSVFLTLAHHAGQLDFGAVMTAAHVDEDWNIAEWGEDEEAMARRAQREKDAAAASLVLQN